MKKILLIALCTASFNFLHAQASYGLKAGLNIATLSGDDVDVKSKLGFNAGVFAEFPIANSISFRPELVYSGQGAKDDDGADDVKLNLGYLNLPLLAKWSSEGGFFAETGPQIGFLMSAKAKNDDESQDLKDAYKSTDFSWAFGLGYKITPMIGVNGRYNLGLSKLGDNSDAKVKNSVFQIGLFYTFGSASM